SSAQTKEAEGEWRKSSTLPWLIAALNEGSNGSSLSSDLISAAERVPASSVAYPSVALYSIKKSIERGEEDYARKKLDSVLLSKEIKMPTSSINLFRELRCSLAQNLDEFLEYAQRTPVGTDDHGYFYNQTPFDPEEINALKIKDYFDWDSLNIFNMEMPL